MKAGKRLLFVCSARSWGGNEKWSAMAMNSLAARGYEVTLLCRFPGIWKGRLSGVTSLGAPLFLHLNPFSYMAAMLILGHRNIDCIISTKRAEYVVMGILSRLLGIRHLIRLGIVRPIDSRYKEWVYGRLNDGIIVNASRTRDVLAESPAIEEERVRLIYNGIPNPPEPRGSREPGDRRFRIVSVGALHPRKGFDKLISAVAVLPVEKAGRVELVFVGDGPARRDLEKAAESSGLADRVVFTGFLADAGPELERADLFALITENEGISNALLEAMSRGVPVLTTGAGGTTDFLIDGENGFLANTDPGAVAAKISALMDRSDLDDVGLRGREKVMGFFSLERMAEQLESFIAGAGS